MGEMCAAPRWPGSVRADTAVTGGGRLRTEGMCCLRKL